MTNSVWNDQVKKTHLGQGFEPRKTGESTDTYNKRVAAHDWAKNNK